MKWFRILLPKQGYKKIGLIDIYKQYANKEINVQSVMQYSKGRKLCDFDFC